MKLIDKEKENLKKIMAIRNIIYSTLKSNVIFALVKKAKNVPGMDFKHLDFMTEKVIDKVSKSIAETLKDSIDIIEVKLNDTSKLQELLDETITVEYLKNLMIDFQREKSKFDAQKFKEGHEILFGETEVNKL